MDLETKQAIQALLAHATAQTALLAVVARYYSGLTARELVVGMPKRLRAEIENSLPEAAELIDRLGIPLEKSARD